MLFVEWTLIEQDSSWSGDWFSFTGSVLHIEDRTHIQLDKPVLRVGEQVDIIAAIHLKENKKRLKSETAFPL